MNLAISYLLGVGFGLSILYCIVDWTAYWRTERPMVGFDHKARRIRALSLHGTPFRSRKHGR